MRREGRLHGTNVRVKKKDVDYLQKASAKPTNHSKISARCPGSKVHCHGCSNGTPVKNSIGKVKTASKAWDLDVTRNYKMSEWRFSQKHRWGNISCDEYDEQSAGDDEEQHTERARGFWKSSAVDEAENEYWENEPTPSPEMVCPIEYLLQMCGNSRPATGPLKDDDRLESPPFMPESLVMTHGALIDDGDDGWCDLDFSEDDDEEEVVEVEDWVLVTDSD